MDSGLGTPDANVLPTDRFSTLFAQQLKNLLSSNQGADVTISCSDGVNLRCHRLVLMAHTHFFENNLAAGGGIVQVDYDSGVMNRLLNMLYGNQQSVVTVSESMEILPLAVQFAMSALERLLVDHIQSTIVAGNVLSFLVYASTVAKSELLETAVIEHFERLAGQHRESGSSDSSLPPALARMIDAAWRQRGGGASSDANSGATL